MARQDRRIIWNQNCNHLVIKNANKESILLPKKGTQFFSSKSKFLYKIYSFSSYNDIIFEKKWGKTVVFPHFHI